MLGRAVTGHITDKIQQENDVKRQSNGWLESSYDLTYQKTKTFRTLTRPAHYLQLNILLMYLTDKNYRDHAFSRSNDDNKLSNRSIHRPT